MQAALLRCSIACVIFVFNSVLLYAQDSNWQNNLDKVQVAIQCLLRCYKVDAEPKSLTDAKAILESVRDGLEIKKEEFDRKKSIEKSSVAKLCSDFLTSILDMDIGSRSKDYVLMDLSCSSIIYNWSLLYASLRQHVLPGKSTQDLFFDSLADVIRRVDSTDQYLRDPDTGQFKRLYDTLSAFRKTLDTFLTAKDTIWFWNLRDSLKSFLRDSLDRSPLSPFDSAQVNYWLQKRFYSLDSCCTESKDSLLSLLERVQSLRPEVEVILMGGIHSDASQFVGSADLFSSIGDLRSLLVGLGMYADGGFKAHLGGRYSVDEWDFFITAGLVASSARFNSERGEEVSLNAMWKDVGLGVGFSNPYGPFVRVIILRAALLRPG